MHTHKKILAALATGFALLAIPAQAQSTITAGFNDLVLGFRATSGTGSTLNLEVDLGSISQFQSPSSSSFTLTRLSALDLTSTYGSSWNASGTTVTWGIVGTTGATAAGTGGVPAKTLWATKPWDVSGATDVAGTAWNRGSTFAQQAPANAIATLFTGANALNGATSTANSAFSAVFTAGTPNSDSTWSSLDLKTANVSFGYFNPTVDQTADFSLAQGSYLLSDLYQITPGSGASTYLGTFGLKADGTLTFATSSSFFTTAVPEPSTYAAIAGALALGLVVIRRRRQAAAA